MANSANAFGLKHIGYLEGHAPSYGLRHRKILLSNANPIFRGDPVTSQASGYIAQAVTGAAVQWAGVFSHCEYYSVSQQRKVRSNYWPGSDAQFDPDCFIIDAAFALFLAASDSGGPIVFGNVDNNIDVTIATGGSATPTVGSGQGNTVSQLSGAILKFSSIGATATLPLRIHSLYSDYIAQGAPNAGTTSVNGADNTTPFNWAVVTFNNVDTKSLTGI